MRHASSSESIDKAVEALTEGEHTDHDALLTIIVAVGRDVCHWLDRTHDAINQVAILADKVNHNGMTDPPLPTVAERSGQTKLDLVNTPGDRARGLVGEAIDAAEIAQTVCRSELTGTNAGADGDGHLHVAVVMLRNALTSLARPD